MSFDVFKNYARTVIPVAKPLTADLAETPPELTVVVPPVGESREIASPTLEKSDTAVQVLLNILPPGLGTQIRVNGRLIQDEASTATLELSSMKPFSVSISRPGFQDWFGSLDPTQLRKSIGNQPAADVRMIPKRYGLLKVQTGTSAEVTIMVQGIPWTLLTPIEGERLPVGTYSIRVVNQIRNVRRDFVVKIEEGKIKEIHEDL